MSLKIFDFAKTYGVVNGVKLYFNRKYKKTSTVKFPFLKYPVEFRGQFNKSDLQMFGQIFHSKEYDIKVPMDPKIIMDLGANVGFASVYFADRFPGAKIIALEPDKENFELAGRNVKPYKNVQLINGAVWNKPEEIHVVDKGYGEGAFMIEAGKGADVVQAYTIKQLMEIMKTDFIDVLKIDIEGSEKEIFEYGFEDWLPHTKIILVETHDRYRKGTSKAVFNTISKYDFSLELSGENLVFYNNNLINPY
ncbi:MAG: FkbM family methyltransferase [Segetibacter sp.]|nr:FkbM family methyltransferase [Segetibacter sp.]